MQISGAMQSYRHFREVAFNWIDECSVVNKLILSLCFAVFTGIMAQIRIYLPFTPVPITGQVFAVLLTASVLGAYYGSLSQIIYVGIGALGMSWFNGGVGGLSPLLGITGGYLIGFIPAVFVVGMLTRKFVALRNFHFQLLLMMGGVAVIYLFGAIQIAMILKISVFETIKLAVLPFIALDLIKAVFVAGISTSILPK